MKTFVCRFAMIIAFGIVATAACKKNSDNKNESGGGPAGVHFKLNGKQYDIPIVRGIYDASSKTFAIYNAGMERFPDTTITLSIGADFTGSTGTFKSDDADKGFVFGFALFGGSLTNPLVGAGAGQNETDNAETVANTPVSITVNSFSASGSPANANGNVTATGTFSGTAYDILNKTFVPLTEGTFNVHP